MKRIDELYIAVCLGNGCEQDRRGSRKTFPVRINKMVSSAFGECGLFSNQ